MKFKPKQSVDRTFCTTFFGMGAQEERLKLLKELFTDPSSFLDNYYTPKQRDKILSILERVSK